MSSIHPIEIEDFTGYHFLSELKISKDAQYASFMTHLSNEEGYGSDLWICGTQGDAPEVKQLTSSGDVCLACWMDEKSLLFSSKRDRFAQPSGQTSSKETSFYRIHIDGGEAKKIFTIYGEVSDIQMISETSFIVCLSYDNCFPDLTDSDKEIRKQALHNQEEEEDYLIFDELPFWSNGEGCTNKIRNRLYLYDTADHRLTALTPPLYQVAGWNISPDRKKMVCFGSSYDDKTSIYHDLRVYDIESGDITTLVGDGCYRIDHAEFMGEEILFLGSDCEDYGWNEDAVFYIADRDGRVVLFYGEDFSPGNSVLSDCRFGEGTSCKICDESLLFIATNRFNSHLCRMTADGLSFLTRAEGTVDCFDGCADQCLFIGTREMRLQEIYALDLTDGSETQLTHMNEAFLADKSVSSPRPLLFVNRDGVEINGWVLEPAGYNRAMKYPAILDIHGGPKAAYGPVFFHEMQVWTGKGYFVFFCNPRGGAGRGNQFSDIRGKYGEDDYQDIMAFTDQVLKAYPAIDAHRLGVTGGSYGGFMTNWIIGHSDRFAAAVSQRSIASWISFGGISDIGLHFAEDQTMATTWDHFDRLWRQSPLSVADQCKTPTLFLHSREDYRCPECESIQMFSALKRFGVPARLVLFNGENHNLSYSGKPKHRKRRLKEICDWFDRYLK